MNTFDIIMPFYCLVVVAVGIIGDLAIPISDEIYEMDLVLIDKNEFVRFIFIYQFIVYELLEDEINKSGIIILEFLTTLIVWPLNVLIFTRAVFLLVVKLICHLFWFIFRKREDENADD